MCLAVVSQFYIGRCEVYVAKLWRENESSGSVVRASEGLGLDSQLSQNISVDSIHSLSPKLNTSYVWPTFKGLRSSPQSRMEMSLSASVVPGVCTVSFGCSSHL